jgi:hypothetical protein
MFGKRMIQFMNLKRSEKIYKVKIEIVFFKDIKYFEFGLKAISKQEAKKLAEQYVLNNIEVTAVSVNKVMAKKTGIQ